MVSLAAVPSRWEMASDRHERGCQLRRPYFGSSTQVCSPHRHLNSLSEVRHPFRAAPRLLQRQLVSIPSVHDGRDGSEASVLASVGFSEAGDYRAASLGQSSLISEMAPVDMLRITWWLRCSGVQQEGSRLTSRRGSRGLAASDFFYREICPCA